MVRKIASPKAPEKIAPTATEISVARNGLLKPYAVCFQHLPDNIAREPLGMLAGVMTINDRSEHSAYIVNFLSSLAKKEYYGNPRRGAIESFEAALHKVNIGLAELAKEGNTEWIGTLDAAICIIERNNLHFSVAGNAKVLLFRDHHLSDISEGLADSDNDHPMKTFTDVASGKISPSDRILITTPEIFSILSEAELERSANRLPSDQFEQLLQTATINQLDLSASILITIGTVAEYERKPAPKRTLATIDSVPNAWSHAIFESSKQQGNSVEDGLREKERHEQDRIDNKTGHIYVTGETPGEETNETWERARIFFGDARASLQHTGAHLGKRFLFILISGSHNLWIFSVKIASNALDALRSWNEKRHLSKLPQTETEQTTPEERLSKNIPLAETNITFTKELGRWTVLSSSISIKTRQALQKFPRLSLLKRNTVRIPVQGESKIALFFKAFLQTGTVIFSRSARAFFFPRTFFNNLPLQKQKIAKITALTLLCIVTFLLFWTFFAKDDLTKTTAEESANAVNATPETPRALSDDVHIHFIENTPVIATFSDIVSITHLQETIFFITRDALYSTGSDGGNAIQVAYPQGETARMGTVMPALNAILILTESGNILFFTPSTNTFADEHFTLPDAANIISIAASSTYLYALNQTQNMLLRYPRTEGGFGVATEWFREPISIQPEATLAVSDSVFIADRLGIHTYFQGTEKTENFESSTTPILPTDILIISSKEGSSQIFILDGAAGRIVRYDASTGSIGVQYASDSLKGATHFTINPTTQTAFVSVGNSIIMVDMEMAQ
ncbi:MAG: hypothetical protein IPJ67_02600 [Candidatus Moraniibacteriota bacterium]|nr:MAG: hypothetical protein IPJ67_02600 [Candidatus Moranbacteria bacterium]